jgi:RNA polymerase sigma-70 factor (ECF subfamily)
MAAMPGDGIELARGVGLPMREESVSEVPEDGAWVSAARAGDRAAFAHLYERYARMVHGVLLAKVPVDEVDDLVQDVFMIALRKLSTLREPGSFGAWLATIARNRANDFYRHSAPEDQLDDSDESAESGDAAPGRDQATEILETIRSLPDAYRETLILRLVEGMTGPEIAARTGLTHGSVRVNLHRGMQQLRAKLKLDSQGDAPEEENL